MSITIQNKKRAKTSLSVIIPVLIKRITSSVRAAELVPLFHGLLLVYTR